MTTFPVAHGCPFHQPPAYDALREHDPVARVDIPGAKQAWALTRYADVRAALADPRLSSDPGAPGFPELHPTTSPAEEDGPRMLIELDGVEHHRLRRMLAGEFTARRVTALRPRIQQIADQFVDTMLAAGPDADIVTDLALPVPSLVICELLGVPYADHEFFQSRTRTAVSTGAGQAAVEAAYGELAGYLDQLVTAKEHEPTDDLLGRLAGHVAAGALTHDELVAAAMLLLGAGHETTATMIAFGAAALLTHPDQLAELRRAPAGTGAAVEELLRFFSIADADSARTATTALEIDGRTIAAGDGIIPVIAAANHDPEVFAEPDRLDLTRDARAHLAFGHGAHLCLGHNLARAELEITLATLVRRIPGLALAVPTERLALDTDSRILRLDAVPVTW